MARSRPLLNCIFLLPVLTSVLAANYSRFRHKGLGTFNDERGPSASSGEWFNNSMATDGGAVDGAGSTGVFGETLGAIWQKVRPYLMREEVTDLGERLATYRKQLLTDADDLVSLYKHAADSYRLAGMKQTVGIEEKDEEKAEIVGARGRRRAYENLQVNMALYTDPDGVPVLSAVEGLISLGLRGSQRVYMTTWHNRLIVTVIDNTKNVSLNAVDQHTLQVRRSAGPRGKFCTFSHVSRDRLVLVCITAGEPVYYHGCFGYQDTQKEVDVAVFLVDEEAPGRGFLTLHLLQAISIASPLYVHSWNQHNKTFLMIVNSEVKARSEEDTTTTYHTTSRVYQWTGQYFDIIQELPGIHPKAAHHFIINGFHFIAVANFLNNKGQHNCHSFIYRYSLDVERYVPFQTVVTRGASHMQSFTLGDGILPHTFLAIANYCQDDDQEPGICNPSTTSDIYRYQLGKFVLFQKIPTTYAVQWLAVQVEDTALLAVVSSTTSVKFYQYNGWRFVPTTYQHTSGPFSVGVTSIAALSWRGYVVIGVSNEDDAVSHGAPTIYTASFNTDKSLQAFHMASKRWCQNRKAQLKNRDLSTLRRLLGAETNAFTQPVVIEGNLVVKGPSRVSKVYIRERNEWLPSTLDNLENKINVLRELMERAREKLLNTITHTGSVTWPDDLHFEHLTVTGPFSVSSVDNLWTRWVNGQQFPDDRFLVRLADTNQHMGGRYWQHVDVQSVSRVRKLQGRPMSSYVTLAGRHTISGQTTFLTVLRTPRVIVASTLDNLNPGSLLLTITNQAHTGWVRCDSLEAAALHVGTINNVNISQLFPSLVTRDAPATITGQVRVLGDLVYPRNLEVMVTSNIDLVNPLRTDDQGVQVVTGEHRVGGVRTPTVRVGGKVNNVRVPEEVFLRHSNVSYRMSSASFTHLLADSLTIATALDTITVSDGQLDVLRVTGSQTVMSYKRFSSIRLLQQHPSIYGGRRRRRTGSGEATCGFHVGRGLTEGETRTKALLLSLRSVTFAQDLLTFLTDIHSGSLTHSQQSIRFFTRLTQDAACAFSEIEDGDGVLFFDMNNKDWKNDGDAATTQLNVDDITLMVANIENFKTELTEDLRNLQLVWLDIYQLYSDARRYTKAYERSLNILELLKLVFGSKITTHTQEGDVENCKSLCPTLNHKNLIGNATRGRNCRLVVNLVASVVRRIHRYPSIIKTMSHLSGNQVQVLQMAMIEHDLGRLVEVIKMKEDLLGALSDAVRCGAVQGTREDTQEVLEMLTYYEQELKKAATFSFTRVKGRTDLPDHLRMLVDDATSSTVATFAKSLVVVNLTTTPNELVALPIPGVNTFSPAGLRGDSGDAIGSTINLNFSSASDPKTLYIGKGVKQEEGQEHLIKFTDEEESGATNTTASPKPLQGTINSQERVESFIKTLKGYIKDIGSSGVRSFMSQWSKDDFIHEYKAMEDMFYKDPKLITVDMEEKIINAHRLMDEITAAVLTFELEQKQKSVSGQKVSEPAVGVMQERNPPTNIYVHPRRRSVLEREQQLVINSSHSTYIPAWQKVNGKSSDLTELRTTTKEYHHTTARYFMHLTTYIDCTDCQVDASSVSRVLLMIAMTTAVPQLYFTNFFKAPASTHASTSHSFTLHPDVTIAYSKVNSTVNGFPPIRSATIGILSEKVPTKATDAESHHSSSFIKLGATVALTSKTVRKRDARNGLGDPGTPYTDTANTIGDNRFNFFIDRDHLVLPLQPSYADEPSSNSAVTHSFRFATISITESSQADETTPIASSQYWNPVSGALLREEKYVNSDYPARPLYTGSERSNLEPYYTTLDAGNSSGKDVIINVIREFHYTTATTRLNHQTTYIACTGCTIIYPSSGVVAIGSDMYRGLRVTTTDSGLASSHPGDFYVTIETHVYQCTVAASLYPSVLDSLSSQVCASSTGVDFYRSTFSSPAGIGRTLKSSESSTRLKTLTTTSPYIKPSTITSRLLYYSPVLSLEPSLDPYPEVFPEPIPEPHSEPIPEPHSEPIPEPSPSVTPSSVTCKIPHPGQLDMTIEKLQNALDFLHSLNTTLQTPLKTGHDVDDPSEKNYLLYVSKKANETVNALVENPMMAVLTLNDKIFKTKSRNLKVAMNYASIIDFTFDEDLVRRLQEMHRQVSVGETRVMEVLLCLKGVKQVSSGTTAETSSTGGVPGTTTSSLTTEYTTLHTAFIGRALRPREPSAQKETSTEPSLQPHPYFESVTEPSNEYTLEPSLEPSPDPSPEPFPPVTPSNATCKIPHPGQLNMTIEKLQNALDFLHSLITTLQTPLKTGPDVEDAGMTDYFIYVSEKANETVNALVENSTTTALTLDDEILKIDSKNLETAIIYASSDGFIFDEDLVRRLQEMHRQVSVGETRVMEALLCLKGEKPVSSGTTAETSSTTGGVPGTTTSSLTPEYTTSSPVVIGRALRPLKSSTQEETSTGSPLQPQTYHEPFPKPSNENIPKPSSERTTEPSSEIALEYSPEPTFQPTLEPSSNPTPESPPEPILKPSAKPTPESIPEPTPESIPEPTPESTPSVTPSSVTCKIPHPGQLNMTIEKLQNALDFLHSLITTLQTPLKTGPDVEDAGMTDFFIYVSEKANKTVNALVENSTTTALTLDDEILKTDAENLETAIFYASSDGFIFDEDLVRRLQEMHRQVFVGETRVMEALLCLKGEKPVSSGTTAETSSTTGGVPGTITSSLTPEYTTSSPVVIGRALRPLKSSTQEETSTGSPLQPQMFHEASFEPITEPFFKHTPESSLETFPELYTEPTSEPILEPYYEISYDPTPEPASDPTPEPASDPTPEPASDPTPEPASDPTPEPTSDPIRDPTPEPTPKTFPEYFSGLTHEFISEPYSESSPEPTPPVTPSNVTCKIPHPGQLNMTIEKLQNALDFLHSLITTLQTPLKTGPDVEDAGMTDFLIYVSEKANKTVNALVENSTTTAVTLDDEILKTDAENLETAIFYASSDGFIFDEDLVRRLQEMHRQVSVGETRVMEALLCLKGEKPVSSGTTAETSSTTGGVPGTTTSSLTPEYTTSSPVVIGRALRPLKSSTQEETSTGSPLQPQMFPETSAEASLEPITEPFFKHTPESSLETFPELTLESSPSVTPSSVTCKIPHPGQLNMTIEKLQNALDFLHSLITTLQTPLKTGPDVEDAGMTDYLIYVSEKANKTVNALADNSTTTALTLDDKILKMDTKNLEEMIEFASKSGLVFNETLVNCLHEMGRRVFEIWVSVTEALLCYKREVQVLATTRDVPHSTYTDEAMTPWGLKYTPDILNTTGYTPGVPVTSREHNFFTDPTIAMSPGVNSDVPSTREERRLNRTREEPDLRLSGGSRSWQQQGSWVEGRVSGYILEDLFHSRPLPSSTTDQLLFIVNNMDKIRNLVFKSELHVRTVNGVEVRRIEEHGQLLTTPSITTFLTFTQPVQVSGEVKAGTINGVPAASYLTLHYPHSLPLPVTFQNDVVVRGQVKVRSTVNNIDLVAFKSIVALISSSGAQVFLTPVTFMNVSSLRLECETGRLAGVPLGDLLLLRETAVITGQKRFLEVRVGEFQVGDLQVDLVNGINVSNLFHHSLRKHPAGPQVVSGSLQVKQMVVLQDLTSGGFTIFDQQQGLTSVFKLNRLSGSVLYRDLPTNLTGSLLLRGVTSVTSLTFLDTFDMVSATRYGNGWLLRTSRQIIGGQVTVTSMTSSDATTVPGVKVQGVDIFRLVNGTAFLDGPQRVTSPVRFGEVYASWVKVAGLVQGWDLSEDAILQGSPNIIFTSLKIFLASVTITGSFRAASGISGVDTDKACNNQLDIDKITIKGNVRLVRGMSTGMVHIGPHIITWEGLKDYWMKDKSVSLPNPTSFRHLVTQHLSLRGTINGIDLQELSAQTLRNTCSDWEKYTGMMNTGVLTVDNVITPKVTTNTLNGRPVTDLRSILTLGGQQVITGHWTVPYIHVTGDLVTSELVNGMKMTHFCLVRRTCVIRATKIFTQDLIVRGDHVVRPGSTVQGVDVSELGQSPKITGCPFSSFTIFKGGITALGPTLVRGLVDGVTLTQETLLTSMGNQVMKRRLTVKQKGLAVTAPTILSRDNLFNNLNLSRLLTLTFKHGSLSEVEAPVRFLTVVVFGSATYGPETRPMKMSITNLWDPTKLKQACNLLYLLAYNTHWAVKHRVQELWGWRRVQRFDATINHIKHLRMDKEVVGTPSTVPSSLQYLALIPRFNSTRILLYSPNDGRYHDRGIVLDGQCTKTVAGYRTRIGDYVVTGHACHHDPYLGPTVEVTEEDDKWVKVWRITPSGAHLIKRIPTPGANDIQVVYLKGVLCMVVVEAHGVDVVVFCEREPNTFLQHQRLPFDDPLKASIVQHRDPSGRMWTFLVVASWGRSPQHLSSFSVWRYDMEEDAFSLLQRVSLDNVQWIDLASHGSNLFLAVVSMGFRGNWEGEVNIYRMDWYNEGDDKPLRPYGSSSGKLTTLSATPTFVLMQEVAVNQPLAVHFARLPSGELYLYVISKGYITWFSQKGMQRFMKGGELYVPGKQAMDVWVYEGPKTTFLHRISVAGDVCSTQDETIAEPTEILEANIRPDPLVHY